MQFRKKSIADSVAERIGAIVQGRASMPASKGAATVNLQRGDNGDLIVTKTFESGEPEVLTIASAGGGQPAAPSDQPDPANLETVVPAEGSAVGALPDAAVSGVVGNTALGGNAIDQLLGG